MKRKNISLRVQAITQQACDVVDLYRIWLRRETGVLKPRYEIISEAIIKELGGIAAGEKV